ncbi:serine/threonine-protein kinase [Kitasatospora fiedleri]|uniref:serine/threonine-protein kinase n=1 Tax=Kitasatospora fiedleri TaxID=2991545 RepID=UPI00249AF815|nr:serine/threonine-protein kinase [Kitasatospora fiedleri]
MSDDQHPEGRPADRPPQDARWELPDYAHGGELGAGASGRVVLARHRATGTPVAVKYLLGDHPDQAAFRVEAELLAALDSPHVTRLYEYVEGPRGAAIVMELVEGVSLRDLLRAEGGTGPEAALVVLKGSLLGLAAAHRAGVVHRDYKPGNVLVTADGESKLVDFGIAVRTGSGGTVAGTPAYMAPEQWAGRPASPATDVYAATATFFECLTGAKPYAGTTLMELAVQHTEAEIPDVQAPEALRPLIRAGLAKTPNSAPPARRPWSANWRPPPGPPTVRTGRTADANGWPRWSPCCRCCCPPPSARARCPARPRTRRRCSPRRHRPRARAFRSGDG